MDVSKQKRVRIKETSCDIFFHICNVQFVRKVDWVWWCMPATLTIGRKEQGKSYKFKESLVYTVKSSQLDLHSEPPPISEKQTKEMNKQEKNQFKQI